jgi:hypothetical protein
LVRWGNMSDRIQRQLNELTSVRAAAVAELRAAFGAHGYDVHAYADDELSRAIVAESGGDGKDSAQLLARAFARLSSSGRVAEKTVVR